MRHTRTRRCRCRKRIIEEREINIRMTFNVRPYLQAEKISRGALKAAVERGLTKSETLIADDLNYIKGYRYELFCVARAVGTSMCTIHCDAEPEQIQQFNSATSAYDDRHIEVIEASAPML